MGDAMMPAYNLTVKGTIRSSSGIRSVRISSGNDTRTCDPGEFTNTSFACAFRFPYNARAVLAEVTDYEGQTNQVQQNISFRFDLPPPPPPPKKMLPFL